MAFLAYSVYFHQPKCQFTNNTETACELILKEEEPETISPKKLLKVAILGRPNAGKSTLINKIMQLNVCDVSAKTHTTRFPLKAALISKNTQIIFIDTPGLVTKKEFSRFKLTTSYLNWKEKVFGEVDMIGIIQEVPIYRKYIRIHSSLSKCLENVPEHVPMFLILNKVDLIKNSNHLAKITKRVMTDASEVDKKNSNDLSKFSKIFFVSALKSEGVHEIVDYLQQNAKEGEWLLKDGEVCNLPLNLLITNLLRSKLMNVLPHEVPYQCRYEVEYLEENDLGQIVCVALITCRLLRHQSLIIKNRKKQNILKVLCEEIESDLYYILKKVVRLRVVVITKGRKESRVR